MLGRRRRLAAIMVADMVGYTEHLLADEEATHRQLTADIDSLFVPRIKSGGGRIVKETGDGLMAEFHSVVDCLECSIDVQKEIERRRAGLPEGQRFRYRIAINVGDIFGERGDIYGDSVNLAVRLQTFAAPGGIVLSGDAYRQIKGKLDATFDDLGERAIKGFDEPVRVYGFAPGGRATSASAPAAPIHPPHPAMASVAVLPFDNLSGDPDQKYFSEGITNDIITDLSRFSRLFVLASHTVSSFKGRKSPVQEISRILGVRYVVEGSIQNAGDRVRINVQLVDGESGRHLWAGRSNRPLKELFDLQDEIVQTIVGTIVGRVTLSEVRRVSGQKTSDLGAYDALLRGRHAFSAWTQEANLKAQAFYKHAITLDPNYAAAHGALSYALVQSWLGGWAESPDTLTVARELARKAVELGPTDSDNYWSFGAACLFNREFGRAIAAYERAAELNPNDPDMLVDMAEALVYVNRPQEAIAKIRRAMQLNPIYPGWYLWNLGIALYHAGEYAQCVAEMTRGELPNLARRIIAAAHIRLGNLQAARQAVAEFLRNDPTYTLARERVWPYQDQTILEELIIDLKKAGIPDDTGQQGGAGSEASK
jgi:adenylate cyclase